MQCVAHEFSSKCVCLCVVRPMQTMTNRTGIVKLATILMKWLCLSMMLAWCGRSLWPIHRKSVCVYVFELKIMMFHYGNEWFYHTIFAKMMWWNHTYVPALTLFVNLWFLCFHALASSLIHETHFLIPTDYSPLKIGIVKIYCILNECTMYSKWVCASTWSAW